MREKKGMSFTAGKVVGVVFLLVVLWAGAKFSAEAQGNSIGLIGSPTDRGDELIGETDISISELLSSLNFEDDYERSFTSDNPDVDRTISDLTDVSMITSTERINLKTHKNKLPSYTRDTFDRIEQIDIGTRDGIEYLSDQSTEQGVSPLLVLLVATRESRGDPNAVSPTGAAGLTQFTSGTARTSPFDQIFGEVTACCTAEEARTWLNTRASSDSCAHPDVRDCPVDDPRFDPAKSLEASAVYLGSLVKAYGGNIVLILTAYNAGPGISNECQTVVGQEEIIDCVLDEVAIVYGEGKVDELSGYIAEIAVDYKDVLEQAGALRETS